VPMWTTWAGGGVDHRLSTGRLQTNLFCAFREFVLESEVSIFCVSDVFTRDTVQTSVVGGAKIKSITQVHISWLAMKFNYWVTSEKLTQ